MNSAAQALASRIGQVPEIAVVLGSGLGALADALDQPVEIPYEEIPGFPDPGVAGHHGAVVVGRLAGVRVMLQSGRFHLYEGHDPATVILPVRTFATLGTKTVIVTNAAGGINPTFMPPTLMLIADHINLMWRSPLQGAVVGAETRFPDMSEPYAKELRALARQAALKAGIRLHEGVYAGVLGPAYETAAEIGMLERMGADAVGMSTVPEVIAARANGMRVLGISTISNLAAGKSPVRLHHDDVLAAGAQVQSDLEALVRGVIQRL